MPLHTSAKGLLLQLRFTIEQLDARDFRMPIPILSDSTLGQHIRHTLEFFLCLIEARNEGYINYDCRKHDTIIETDKKLALDVADSILEFFEKEQDDFPLVHKANYEMKDSPPVSMQSSYYRELSYNIEHAIHHMALIKVGLNQSFPYVTLPPHFGVANSTVRFQEAKD